MAKDFEKALFEAFSQMGKNTIEISYGSSKGTGEKGLSKIGGKPNLPRNFQWPYYKGGSGDDVAVDRPLAFLAEIHLSQASKFDKDNLLPKTGVLSFFYELESQQWGFDPKDKGCARVYYFEDESALFESELPEDLNEDYYLAETFVSFEQKTSLPSYVSFEDTPQGKEFYKEFSSEMDDLYDEDYDELKEDYGCSSDSEGGTHKMLGYPDVIQNPMEKECEAVSRGIYMGGGEKIPAKLEEEIKEASKDWILLLQLGTLESEESEVMFGDCGYIYFWLRKDDLARKNFDNVWLTLQCG